MTNPMGFACVECALRVRGIYLLPTSCLAPPPQPCPPRTLLPPRPCPAPPRPRLWRAYFNYSYAYDQLPDFNRPHIFVNSPHGAFPLSQVGGGVCVCKCVHAGSLAGCTCAIAYRVTGLDGCQPPKHSQALGASWVPFHYPSPTALTTRLTPTCHTPTFRTPTCRTPTDPVHLPVQHRVAGLPRAQPGGLGAVVHTAVAPHEGGAGGRARQPGQRAHAAEAPRVGGRGVAWRVMECATGRAVACAVQYYTVSQ